MIVFAVKAARICEFFNKTTLTIELLPTIPVQQLAGDYVAECQDGGLAPSPARAGAE